MTGDLNPPLTTLNLSPTAEGPVAERVQLPKSSTFLAGPAFMRTMYFSYGALQAADIRSTLVALNQGAHEANPMMRSFAKNPARLIGVKVAASAGTIFIIEKLRKRRPVTAAVALAAFNTALALVVTNNTKVILVQKKP